MENLVTVLVGIVYVVLVIASEAPKDIRACLQTKRLFVDGTTCSPTSQELKDKFLKHNKRKIITFKLWKVFKVSYSNEVWQFVRHNKWSILNKF